MKRAGELTEKQQLFIENYCNPKSSTFGNGTKSYLASGYSCNKSAAISACRLLNSDKIKQAIELWKAKRDKEQAKRESITDDYALAKLKEHLERCEANSDNTNTTACIRLLLQTRGLLVDRKEIEQTNHNVANITPQELEALEAIARANNIRLSQKQG
jgi:hypothetical protein